MCDREAEILQTLEDKGLINAPQLAELIDCSAPTARNRIAAGGLRLQEAKLLLERTKDDPRIGDAIDDHLHAHTGRISVRLDDVTDLDGDGEETVMDALAAVDQGNRQMSDLVHHAMDAIRDGEIDENERETLCGSIRAQIRALVQAEKLVHRTTTIRKRAKPVRLAE